MLLFSVIEIVKNSYLKKSNFTFHTFMQATPYAIKNMAFVVKCFFETSKMHNSWDEQEFPYFWVTLPCISDNFDVLLKSLQSFFLLKNLDCLISGKYTKF